MATPENVKAARLMLCRFLACAAMEKGLTQTELAKITGIQRSNISRIMSGKMSVNLDTFLKLAQAIGVKVFLESETNEDNYASKFLEQIKKERLNRNNAI